MSRVGHENDVQYSMRVVTRLTGLSPDTIRAWERRYSAVVPERTDGNTRRYSARDVRRLGLLKEATGRGYRIGDIAQLSEDELVGLSTSEGSLSAASSSASEGLSQQEVAFQKVRQQYLTSIERFDAREAGDLLSRTAALFRPRDFVVEVVLPILRETGDRWHSGQFTVAHEHLVSMQARSLLDAILRLSSPHKGAPRLITATPEGQLHEFGALAGAMLAALRGFDVLYLGPQVPEQDLLNAAEKCQARVVALSIILETPPQKTIQTAHVVENIARFVDTWVGTSEGHPITKHLRQARPLFSFVDYDIALTKLLT